jgi:DNA polymerase-3 subunit epsilon
VHGLTAEKLADAPVFAGIIDALLEFIGESRLVIHNAEFDIKFLNAELARLERPQMNPARGVDTIALAKRRFPARATRSTNSAAASTSICRPHHARRAHRRGIVGPGLFGVDRRAAGAARTRARRCGHNGIGFIRIARPRPVILPERIAVAERESHARFIAAELEGDVIWTWAA